MFIKLIKRNRKMDRKENSIYFVSLLIAIVAFYVVLSLEKQDVMVFLKKMESDAVNHLLGLISGAYGFSLFIIFFLIYFAERYQLHRRSHEYGTLLMLGMRRSRLFVQLLVQDVYSGAAALVVGLPAAILLSEVISLVTVKLTGLGIVGHHFNLSLQAVAQTVLGFLGIKLLANIILSFWLVKKEPYSLMNDVREDSLVLVSNKRSVVQLVTGITSLAAAYIMAIAGVAWTWLPYFGVMLVLGTVGTYLTVRGFCSVFCRLIKKRRSKDSLHIFTFRQLHDNVFLRSGSLTISSLLILVAVSCMGYGISVAVSNVQDGSSHTMDFTFQDDGGDSPADIERLLDSRETRSLTEGYCSVQVAYLPVEGGFGTDTDVQMYEYDASSIQQAAEHLTKSQREYLEGWNMHRDAPHMISLSGINALRRYAGEKELSLGEKELYIYIDPEFYGAEQKALYDELLKHHPAIKIDGKEYAIKGVCSDNIVVDRSITLSFGIILPEETFLGYADPNNISTYWNVYLKESIIEEMGLLRAIMRADSHFEQSGLTYENYLQNIGRQLFYIIAASYLTIYLALIFLIIANTVISLQYLMQEKQNMRRYRTLACLGSPYEALRMSAGRQIKWYFGVPLGLAVLSGIFGVCSLLSGMLPTSLQGHWGLLLAVAFASIAVLFVIECCYVRMVMRQSSRHLMQVMEIRRTE